MILILELIAALSLPIWLAVEEIARFRRQRRQQVRVAARKSSRQTAIDALLLRT